MHFYCEIVYAIMRLHSVLIHGFCSATLRFTMYRYKHFLALKLCQYMKEWYGNVIYDSVAIVC